MSTVDFAIIDNYNNKFYYYASELVDKYGGDWSDVLKKLNAVSIDDDHFHRISIKLDGIPTLTCEHEPSQGIPEYGTTIIPPEQLDVCLNKIRHFRISVYGDVIQLFERAKKENKHVICFA